MLAENLIFIDFFAVKVDTSADVKRCKEGISKKDFIYTVDRFSLWHHFNEDEIFSRQEILQFFSCKSKDYMPWMLYQYYHILT